MFDTCPLEHVPEGQEMLLILGMQSHRNGILRDPFRSRLSSSVDCLGNLRPMGEVSPDNHIVNQIGIGVAIAGLPIVNDSSACPLHSASLRSTQVPL